MILRNNIYTILLSFVLVGLWSGCAQKTAPEMPSAQSEVDAPEPEALATPEPEVEETDSTSDILSSLPVIHFDYNQSLIRSDDRSPLGTVAEALKEKSSVRMTIEGHCDERGSSEYNLALGERRARSVKQYLRTLGISGNRLSTISYGEERPVAQGSYEGAWAQNRRAELIVNQ